MPLVRSGGDESPIAWWEWLFAPIMMPLFIIFLLVMAVVSVPLEFVYRLRQQREEKRLQPRLAAAGRFLDWPAVEAKLQAGEGTLIVEHLSPKGPIREWWAEDDLIAASPVPLPTSLKSPPAEGQLQPLQEFAATCAARYADLASGAAKLTEVPVPLERQLDPAKYVVVDLGGGLMTTILLPTGRRLAGKVVTLVNWLGEPVLFAGDAESVFLADAERRA
ncbi:MAG: hypothetical protein ACRC8S_02405 [Fimbriiglobus sp.]